MINWANIDTVLLDMDGTLLDLHFDNFFWLQHLPQRYAEIHALPKAEAHQKLMHLFTQTKGNLNWYCTEYWAKTLNVNIVQLKTEISHKISLLQHVTPFLNALRAAGKHIALATNAHRESYNLKMDNIDLRPYLDHVSSSHDYGFAKEEQAFWQAFQQSFPFNPSRTLLIDDNEEVLSAALSFGIKYVLAPAQPDSTVVARTDLKHPCFLHYQELLPIHSSL